MANVSESGVEKDPLVATKGGLPDWVPWAVMFGLMVVGSAGALGFVRAPFGSRAPTEEAGNTRVRAVAPPAVTAANPKAPSEPAFQPPPPDNGIRPPGVPEVVEVRQILVQHKSSWKRAEQVTRSKEEAKTRCAEALAKLEHGADWDKVMQEYSDSPDTRRNGGSIGLIKWESASWLIKEPVFKLKLNERSPVTESPFGYHVYQRTK